MIVRALWCASLSTFPLTMFCGSTTKMLTLWSIKSLTAGEEEHADGSYATKLQQRNKMGAGGRLLARCASGKYDSCLRYHRDGHKWKCGRRRRCLRASCANAQEYSIGIGTRRRQHKRRGADAHVCDEHCC